MINVWLSLSAVISYVQVKGLSESRPPLTTTSSLLSTTITYSLSKPSTPQPPSPPLPPSPQPESTTLLPHPKPSLGLTTPPLATTTPTPLEDLTITTDPEIIREGEPFWILCGPDEPGAIWERSVTQRKNASDQTLLLSNESYTPTERDRDGILLGCVAIHRKGIHSNWDRFALAISKLAMPIPKAAERRVSLHIAEFEYKYYCGEKYEFYLNFTDNLTCTTTRFSNIQSIKLEVIGDGNFSIARVMCSDTSNGSSDPSWEVEAVEASGVKLSPNNECNGVATRQQLSLFTQMTLTDVSYTGRIICTAEDDGGVIISSNHTDISEVRVPPPDNLTIRTDPEIVREGNPFQILCGPDEPGADWLLRVAQLKNLSDRIFFKNESYTPTRRDRDGILVGCGAQHRRKIHPNWHGPGLTVGITFKPIPKQSDGVETTPKALKQVLEELESEKSYMLNCKVYLTEGSEWSEYIWYRGGVLEETKTHLLNVSFEGDSGEETEKITCVPVSTEGLVDNDKRIEWEIMWTGELFKEKQEVASSSFSLHGFSWILSTSVLTLYTQY